MAFNPDNCGIRLIPNTAIQKWIQDISKDDSKLQKYLHASEGQLYDYSISPTEEQFLEILGNENIEFKD